MFGLEGVDRWAEEYYQPDDESYDAGLVRGRFNPPGNHHVALVDYVADTYDVDEMYVVVEESERSSRNPMMADEVVSVLEEAAGDQPYDVTVTSRAMDGWNGAMWGNMTDILDANPVYLTGELEQAVVADVRRSYLQMTQNPETDYAIDYTPRHRQDIGCTAPRAECGTEIKTLMHSDDDTWRNYVPAETEWMIEERPEILAAVQDGDPQASGKHLELVL